MLNALTLEGLIYTIVEKSKNQKATYGEIIAKVKEQRYWVTTREIKSTINKLQYKNHVTLLLGSNKRFMVAITEDQFIPSYYVSPVTVTSDLEKKQNFFSVLGNGLRKLFPF